MTTTNLKQTDGYKIKIYTLNSISESHGNILLLTDMREHYERYIDFMNTLAQSGYNVYTYDHRKQSRDYMVSELGHIAAHNGDKLLINDTLAVSKYLLNLDVPLFIIGFGMGGILARIAISRLNDFAGAVIAACEYSSSLNYALKSLYLSVNGIFNNSATVSPKITNKIFEGKNFNSFGNRTSFDWISCDNAQVGNYIHDPHCGYPCSIQFCKDYISLAKTAINKRNLLKADKATPIYIISGSQDPVTDMGSSVNNLHLMYKKLGYKDVRKNLYKNYRHDLMHEKNTNVVIEDIIDWLYTHNS